MSLPKIDLWNQSPTEFRYTTENGIQYIIISLQHTGKRSLRIFDPHVLGWKSFGPYDTTKQAYQAACEYNTTHMPETHTKEI